MLTLSEAAKVFGIRVRTMREWIKLGKVHAEKDKNGWYWLIPEEEIERVCRQRQKTCQTSSKV